MKISYFNTIATHAPKYLTGSVFAGIVGVLMTKYYTSAFSPEEYGILALYLMMFKYVVSLVSLNLDSGSTRYYFDYRLTKRDEYLSTIFWLITSMALVVLILGLIFMPLISDWISPRTRIIYLVTIGSAIATVYVSYFTRILYNEQLSNSVMKHSIFQTCVNHLSSVLFISIFRIGILGRMGGQGLGYLMNMISLLREFKVKNLFILKYSFNKLMAKETVLLTYPSMISTFMGVAFVYLDRVFIKHYMGNSYVGLYSLGFMLGQGLSLIFEAVSQSILPKVFNDMKDDYAKAISELELFSYKYYGGLLLITIVLASLSPFIVRILSNDEYQQAATVMPMILAGFMMGGFYKIPSLILGFHKVVWFHPFLVVISFGTNALLNWKLIPESGIMGAAFASFIGLFIYSLVLQIISAKYMSRKYRTVVFSFYLIVLITLSIFNKEIIL